MVSKTDSTFSSNNRQVFFLIAILVLVLVVVYFGVVNFALAPPLGDDTQVCTSDEDCKVVECEGDLIKTTTATCNPNGQCSDPQTSYKNCSASDSSECITDTTKQVTTYTCSNGKCVQEASYSIDCTDYGENYVCENGECKCKPSSCSQNACGLINDGCGGTIDCGGCTTPQIGCDNLFGKWYEIQYSNPRCENNQCFSSANRVPCTDYNGWYCKNDSAREYREYNDCEEGEGCKYIVTETENCNDLDYCEGTTFLVHEDYSCKDGNCIRDSRVKYDCSKQNGWYCDGSIRQFRDYYCSDSNCTFNVVESENCLFKDSVDNDFGKNYTVKGDCFDYDGCSDGVCTNSTHSDRCFGDYTLFETFPIGTTCYSEFYDCRNLSKEAVDLYGDDYTHVESCSEIQFSKCSSGRCEITYPNNVYTDFCVGVCTGNAPSQNSCMFREYYPIDKDGYTAIKEGCGYKDYDLDTAQILCDRCIGENHYNAGGEVSNCCGDDPSEYYKTFNYPYAGFQDACCDAATDCVDVNGRCIEQGEETIDCDENGLCKIYVCGSGEISEVPVSRDDVCSKKIIDGVNYTLVGNEEFGFRWVDDFTLYNIQYYREGERYFYNASRYFYDASSGCGNLCGCFDYLDTDCDGLGDNLDSDCSLSNSVYDNMDWYIEVGRDRPIRNPEVIPEGWYPALGCDWADFNPHDLSYCNKFYYFNKTWNVDLSKYPNFNNCNDRIDNDMNGCNDNAAVEYSPEGSLPEPSEQGELSTCEVEDVKFIYSKNSEPSKCPSGYDDLGYKLADNDPRSCTMFFFWEICTEAENHYVRACIKTKDCCVDSYFKAGTDSCSSSAMKCPSGSSDYRKCSLIKDEGLFDDNSYAVVCLNLANRGSCEDDSKGCNSLGEFVECSDDTVCRSGACVPNTEDFIPSVLNFSRTGLSSTPVGRRLGDFKCGASEFEAAKRDLSYMLDGIDNDCNGWIDYGYPPNIKRESWKTDGNVEYPADFTDLMPEPGSKMHVKVIVEDSEGNRVKDANVTFYFNTEYRPDLEIPRDYWTAFTDESGEAEFYLNKGFKYNIHVVPPKETGLNEKIIPLRINLGMSDTEITTHITLLGSALAENCNSDCTWGDTNKCDARCAGYNGCKMSGLLLDLCDGKEKGGHSEGNTLFVCCDGSVLETSEDNNEVKVSAPVLKTPDWSSMVLSDQLRVALYDKPVKMKMVLFR